MHKVLIIGAGKIGTLISFLLAHSNRFQVFLADVHKQMPYQRRLESLNNFQYTQMDATNVAGLSQYIQEHGIEAFISSLPFYCNQPVAKVAAENKIHYFDLTEDVETTAMVEKIAKTVDCAFVPQCGLKFAMAL